MADSTDWEQTQELEDAIKDNYERLKAGFQQLESLKDDNEKSDHLKKLTQIMQECKRQVKDFEREARTDGMPPKILSEKKRQLVQELNTYIALKKTNTAQLQARSALTEKDSAQSKEQKLENMKNQQLIQLGKKEITETDAALERARRQVEETIQLGAQTAATLTDQTKQMEGVLNDLDDITFNMKKAQKVIAEITRGLVTDKCILCLVFFIVIAIIIGVIVTILVPSVGPAPPSPESIPGQNAGMEAAQTSPPAGAQARRLLVGDAPWAGPPLREPLAGFT
uniref:Putative plant SNARE n=1 Tax=Tetraselmis sp. GSL018 TaxID=582737 RepID=A0A061RZI5_9CHLO|mmetsp:Transcript_818/g.1971  ORF Transcript_818/g.1971 Transcript_818/m.1971 type:complete len:282 (-) Transcript_818:229-1074(-)